MLTFNTLGKITQGKEWKSHITRNMHYLERNIVVCNSTSVQGTAIFVVKKVGALPFSQTTYCGLIYGCTRKITLATDKWVSRILESQP